MIIAYLAFKKQIKWVCYVLFQPHNPVHILTMRREGRKLTNNMRNITLKLATIVNLPPIFVACHKCGKVFPISDFE